MEEKQSKKGAKVNDCTHPDYVPSIFPVVTCTKEKTAAKSTCKMGRYNRFTQRAASAEQYLERLTKWRTEKKKPLMEIKPNKAPHGDAKTMKKPLAVGHITARPTHNKQKDRISRVGSSVQNVPLPAQSSIKTRKKPSVLDLAEEELMSEKLKRWKNEKGKVSKSTIAPSDVKRPQAGSSTQIKAKQFKEVKSRLLDHLNKAKQSKVNKTDNSIPTGDSKSVCSLKNVKPPPTLTKQKRVPQVTSVKSGLKRRHSDGHALIAEGRKPKGILKRKSCIGSIGEGTGDQLEKNEKPDNDIRDDVFPHVLPDRKCNKPVGVVTPSYSTRSVTFISPADGGEPNGRQKLRKTPKPKMTPPPRSEKTPSTLRRDLNTWLEDKGRTPSKFRHMMCFHDDVNNGEQFNDPQTKSNLSVKELSEQMDIILLEDRDKENQERLKVMLDECMTLYEAGCPAEAILPWLEDIYQKIPTAQTSAQFYVCKANVVKSMLDLDALLDVFHTAVINDAQPKADVASCLTEAIKFVNYEQLRQAKQRSRTPRKQLEKENIFQSSTVKYAVSTVTPFSEPKQSRKDHRSIGQSSEGCTVITPVRRSTRRSLQNLPESLRDKKDMFTSLSDVDESTKETMLFQPNMALEPLLSQAEDDED